jgi:hypothetical protein
VEKAQQAIQFSIVQNLVPLTALEPVCATLAEGIPVFGDVS